MSKPLPCPECGKCPEIQTDSVGYYISCECHDPTPMYGGDNEIPSVSGGGYTEEKAIQSWNRIVQNG